VCKINASVILHNIIINALYYVASVRLVYDYTEKKHYVIVSFYYACDYVICSSAVVLQCSTLASSTVAIMVARVKRMWTRLSALADGIITETRAMVTYKVPLTALLSHKAASHSSDIYKCVITYPWRNPHLNTNSSPRVLLPLLRHK